MRERYYEGTIDPELTAMAQEFFGFNAKQRASWRPPPLIKRLEQPRTPPEPQRPLPLPEEPVPEPAEPPEPSQQALLLSDEPGVEYPARRSRNSPVRP